MWISTISTLWWMVPYPTSGAVEMSKDPGVPPWGTNGPKARGPSTQGSVDGFQDDPVGAARKLYVNGNESRQSPTPPTGRPAAVSGCEEVARRW
ncbi:hypothetical protein QBC40DRAFT_289947 [Triangularia verruculosa]|uniref:Uncharacterized protein n=1 Tax=Triangularia verruculosa TaxID=2587418 RepID=A0AAN7AQ07_9PEZI|nr:hypothetical protein QBC40DRAFT_289947 [Triangularia verruculosa]